MTTRIGNQNAIFGCTDQNFGYIAMVKVDHKPELTMLKNGQSQFKAGEFHSDMQKVTGEYTFLNVTGDPEDIVGTNTGITITDAGLTVYIVGVSNAKKMGDWCKVNFEGHYYPNLGS